MSSSVKPILKGTFSGAFSSQSISKNRVESTSIQMVLGAGITLDVEIQQSLDGSNWATVTGSALTGMTSTNSPIIWDLNNGNPKYYKVVTSNVSGSGEVEIFAN